jgi:hypothetical protein
MILSADWDITHKRLAKRLHFRKSSQQCLNNNADDYFATFDGAVAIDRQGTLKVGS